MEDKVLDKAVGILKNGGVIIFPTDTVWGIGASIERLDGIRRLYELKKRERDKPTAVLVADKAIASRWGVINPAAAKLISFYWPGGLTLVVKAQPATPSMILGSGGTIGLRQPNHELVLSLLKKLNTGLVTASANFSGVTAPIERELIDKILVDQADLIVSGKAGAKPPSTVVDTTVEPLKIIREGEIKVNLPTA